MIRLVIFDLDDVLYGYDRDARVVHLVTVTGLPEAHVRHALWGDDFEDRAEAGEWPRGEDYLREFNRRLGVAVTRADWVAARRISMMPDDVTIGLASAVKERAEVGLLTNNSSLLVEEIAAIAPAIVPVFARRLHGSSQFGARKPDPEVFRRYLKHYGIAPNQSLFVDDAAENVDGAEDAGLAGHHFKGAEGLRRRLEALELIG
jgi:glucose-1-phosphatase